MRIMGWSYDDYMELPYVYREVLIEMLREEHADAEKQKLRQKRELEIQRSSMRRRRR